MSNNGGKIRVLFVSNGLGKGGKERQIHEIISYLNVHREFECGLLLRKPEVAYEIESLQKIHFFIPPHELNSIQFVRFLRDCCSSFKPDVIHTWESWVTNMTHVYRFTLFKKMRVIDGSLRYSKAFKKSGLHYWSARLGRMFAHRVIANSKSGLASIDYGSPGKYLVVANAMNTERLQKFVGGKKANRPFTLSMVASFTKAKDYDTLIITVSEMLKDGYDLRCNLIGDGAQRADMMSLAPSYQSEYFNFTGMVSDPESWLQQSNVGVLLARNGHSEGYSNTIMEFIAAGLPVICTNTGGNPEMVVENKNGFLIQHESKVQLREAIHKLYESSDLCERMGAESRSFAERQFYMSRLIQELLSIYKSVL